jgi:hypothetical protein
MIDEDNNPNESDIDKNDDIDAENDDQDSSIDNDFDNVVDDEDNDNHDEEELAIPLDVIGGIDLQENDTHATINSTFHAVCQHFCDSVRVHFHVWFDNHISGEFRCGELLRYEFMGDFCVRLCGACLRVHLRAYQFLLLDGIQKAFADKLAMSACSLSDRLSGLFTTEESQAHFHDTVFTVVDILVATLNDGTEPLVAVPSCEAQDIIDDHGDDGTADNNIDFEAHNVSFALQADCVDACLNELLDFISLEICCTFDDAPSKAVTSHGLLIFRACQRMLTLFDDDFTRRECQNAIDEDWSVSVFLEFWLDRLCRGLDLDERRYEGITRWVHDLVYSVNFEALGSRELADFWVSGVLTSFSRDC